MFQRSPRDNGGAKLQSRDTLHRLLKSRVVFAGMPLFGYALSEFRQAVERPTLDELRARLRSRAETAPSLIATEAVRVKPECT